jgi:predicted Zn-ribbon and HTH transcriptional regulator
MKGYNIALWFCKTCGWSWQTLSSKFETEDQCPECNSYFETEDQCPECNSYYTQRVIKQQDLV